MRYLILVAYVLPLGACAVGALPPVLGGGCITIYTHQVASLQVWQSAQPLFITLMAVALGFEPCTALKGLGILLACAGHT